MAIFIPNEKPPVCCAKCNFFRNNGTEKRCVVKSQIGRKIPADFPVDYRRACKMIYVPEDTYVSLSYLERMFEKQSFMHDFISCEEVTSILDDSLLKTGFGEEPNKDTYKSPT